MGSPNSRLLPRLTLQRPPLRATADRARGYLESHDEPANRDVVVAVADDPMAAILLMKRANSAFYGLGEHIDSLTHAVEVLGVRPALRLLCGIDPDEGGEPASVVARLYRHAGLTARLAHRLVSGTWPFSTSDGSPTGAVFTAGLLHSLGRIVLAHSLPEQADVLYRSTFVRADSDDGEWQQLERFHFGADHREIGELVARKLRLPESIVQSARRSGSPRNSTPGWHAIDIARKIVDREGYGLASPGSTDQLQHSESWNALVREHMVREDELPLIILELQECAESTRPAKSPSKGRMYASDRASRPVSISGKPDLPLPSPEERNPESFSID